MNRSKKGNMLIFITVLLGISMFMANYGNYQLAAVPGKIYSTYQLTDLQFSSLMTGPMLPSIFLSIIIGILVDRFGITKITSICFTISMIGFIMRVYVTTYNGMLIAMALTGFAGMVLNANLSKIVASLYPPQKNRKHGWYLHDRFHRLYGCCLRNHRYDSFFGNYFLDSRCS